MPETRYRPSEQELTKALELARSAALKRRGGLRGGVAWDVDGLISAAYQGVAKAILTYDPAGGAAFATYALGSAQFALNAEVRAQQPGLYRAQERTAQQAKHSGNDPTLARAYPALLPYEREPISLDGVADPESRRWASKEPNPCEVVINREQAAALTRDVRSAVRSLRGFDRELVESLYFDGMSYSDLGTQLGMTKQGIYNRMRRIYKDLAPRLAAYA